MGPPGGLAAVLQRVPGLPSFEQWIRTIIDSLQCGENACKLFDVNSTCVSQCATCGTLCEAFPISDLGSLQLYKTKGCTVVVGDLYISGLPPTVTRSVLFENLQNVLYLHGDLYMRNNEYIVSMSFLGNLVGLYGAHYDNNPVLVDAQLPSLAQMTSNVTVVGCDRLCPARYTRVGDGASHAGCANTTLNYFVRIEGDFIASSSLMLLGDVFGRVLRNVTSGEVCSSKRINNSIVSLTVDSYCFCCCRLI